MAHKNNKILSATLMVFLALILSGCTPRKASVDGKNQKNQQDSSILLNSPQVVKLNSTWQKYTNKEYKYSMEIPAEFFIKNGSCVKNEGNYYTYKEALSEIKVVENGAVTIFAPKTTYIISGDRNKCEEDTSVESNQETNWKIQAYKAEDIQGISEHIKSAFGKQCALEILKPTKNPEIFDVIIATDQSCEINSAYFFKYNTRTKTGISIILGNTFTFSKDQLFGNNAYDEQMLESLEFTD